MNSAIAFYNGNVWLYLETDALSVSLGASLPQVMGGMQFPMRHVAVCHSGQ